VFLNLGLDISIVDDSGRGLEHYACAGGSFVIARELDNIGAKWRRSQSRGPAHFPAEYAAAFGNLAVMQWLWTKGDLLGVPRVGWSAPGRGEVRMLMSNAPSQCCRDPQILLAAAGHGHSSVVEFLLNHVKVPFGKAGVKGATALHVACRGGHESTAAVLINSGADVSGIMERQRLGVTYEVTPLGEAARAGSLGCARMLLERVSDDAGNPHPVALAAAAGHADVVSLLMEKWPDVNADDAFTAALLMGHTRLARRFEGRSQVTASDWLLTLLPGSGLNLVTNDALKNWLTDDKVRRLYRDREGQAYLKRIAAMGFPTREQSECYAKEAVRAGISPRIASQLRSKGIRASRVCPPYVCYWRLEKLVKLLGPFESLDADPYDLAEGGWGELVLLGAPLRWRRMRTGRSIFISWSE
jgi:hypothetical protein